MAASPENFFLNLNFCDVNGSYVCVHLARPFCDALASLMGRGGAHWRKKYCKECLERGPSGLVIAESGPGGPKVQWKGLVSLPHISLQTQSPFQ